MNFSKKATSIIFTMVIIAATTVCESYGSTPTVTIPGDIQAVAGGKVLVPFQLTGVQGADIGGFFIRIEYDETVLLNPFVVSVGTLTAGISELVHGPASEGDDWDYSVGLASNFAPSEDGILFLIAFDIAAEAYTATVPIGFAGPNEQTYLNVDLASTGFELEIIPAQFVDGSVAVSGQDPFDFEEFQQHWLIDCDSPDWDGAYDYVEDCIIDYLDLQYVGDYFFESSATDSK